MAKVVRNYQRDGIEIYFSSIPSYEVREDLKRNNWRWSPYNKCWWNKYTSQRLEYANRIIATEKVADLSVYKKRNSDWKFGSISNWNTESKLKKLGYSVAKDNMMSTAMRQKLLHDIMDQGKMTPKSVLHHLDMYIESNKNSWWNEDAVYKWQKDREYVLLYMACEMLGVEMKELI